MQIAIASGKGGTGKTTVAVSLAQLVSQNGVSVAYLDCDVEEPNGHIFLKPEFDRVVPVGVQVPKVDEDKCTHCNECGVMCRYSGRQSRGTCADDGNLTFDIPHRSTPSLRDGPINISEPIPFFVTCSMGIESSSARIRGIRPPQNPA